MISTKIYSVVGLRGLTSKYIHLSITQRTLIFSGLIILPVSKGVVDKSLAVLSFCLCISHDSFSCSQNMDFLLWLLSNWESSFSQTLVSEHYFHIA